MYATSMEKTALPIEVSMIPLEEIRTPPGGSSGREAEISKLAVKILRGGANHPITVRPVKGNDKVKYEIVAGDDVFLANQLLARSVADRFSGQVKPGIPAVIKEIPDAEAS